MTTKLQYHLSELKVVRELRNPKRLVPAFACSGWSVLDVGCGIGQTLVAAELSYCRERHGIDIDAEAIEAGSRMFPELDLRVAPAERIPYPDDTFELTYSRVALPYSCVPKALTEIHRVTKPGGFIWLALHPWRMERLNLTEAIRGLRVRRLLDRFYVLAHSAALNYAGVSFARPWNRTYESFQTIRGARSLLTRAGFADVEITDADHFLAVGRKPLAASESSRAEP